MLVIDSIYIYISGVRPEGIHNRSSIHHSAAMYQVLMTGKYQESQTFLKICPSRSTFSANLGSHLRGYDHIKIFVSQQNISEYVADASQDK
jgi:hypothetical protein